MSDEDALQQAAAKAARAQALLGNELLSQAYDDREADLIAAWIATNPADVDARERCFTHLHANRKHRDYLQAYVSNGKLAAEQLRREAELAEHKPRWETIR